MWHQERERMIEKGASEQRRKALENKAHARTRKEHAHVHGEVKHTISFFS